MKIGDKVQWTSQSLAYEKQKIGIVRAVVPAGSRAGGIINAIVKNANSQKKMMTAWPAKDPGAPRKHESYVVEVKNPERGSRLYWPLVKHLTLIPVTQSKEAVTC